MPLLAGADARPITPDLDKRIYLAGFSKNRIAAGMHDPLMVRTLALSDGATTLLLAVCDLLGLARVDTLDIRARLPSRLSVAATSVVIACTHTHSGADTIGLWGPDEATTGCDARYVESVKQQVVASCDAALAGLAPAILRVGTTEVRGIVRNFRDPEIVDHDLVVVQAIDLATATPIFTLLNFPCHPEVMDDDNTLISADMAGFACRAIERGAGGVGIWASGHLGGMMSPDTTIRTFDECRRMGELLGHMGLRGLRLGIIASDAILTCMASEPRIPLHNPLLQRASSAGLLRAGEQRDTVTSDVAVWRIGDVAEMMFVPGELLPKLGLRLKAHMTAPAKCIVGLANDEIGYILPSEDFIFPEDYTRPGKQYEESMSLGPDAGTIIVDTLVKLHEDLH